MNLVIGRWVTFKVTRRFWLFGQKIYHQRKIIDLTDYSTVPTLEHGTIQYRHVKALEAFTDKEQT